ncbi:MAG: DotH/IcmK family type IV secretion protein [Gammaproteobacteria bacterium]
MKHCRENKAGKEKQVQSNIRKIKAGLLLNAVLGCSLGLGLSLPSIAFAADEETPKFKNSYDALNALGQNIEDRKQQDQAKYLASTLGGNQNTHNQSIDKPFTGPGANLSSVTTDNTSSNTNTDIPAVPSPPQNLEELNKPEGRVFTMGPDFGGLPILPEGPKKAKTLPPKTLRSEAFKQLLDSQSPLTPDQILELRKQQELIQRASTVPATAPPRPVSSTMQIELSPGFAPPVIRLAAGYVSSIMFLDSTGKPWPLADYSLGNSREFNIQWDRKTHTLFMQSTTPYATGNMAIRLAKLETPITVSLVAGQKEVDYRLDLQVKARGPNAQAPIVQDLPQATPSYLINALDGIPPPNSQELIVSGGPGRAWLTGSTLIFRSPLTVLSPGWRSTLSSPDGTHVYEMAQTPLILASEAGKPIKIMIKGI